MKPNELLTPNLQGEVAVKQLATYKTVLKNSVLELEKKSKRIEQVGMKAQRVTVNL